jgi:hypothetical protein
MSESLFVADDGGYVATEMATGPWSRDALHGGPVSALLAHLLEAMDGSEGLFPARLTVELLRPVGHQPMEVMLDVVRPGKKVRVCEAHMRVRDDDSDAGYVARATLQQIRLDEIGLPPNHRSVDPHETPPSNPDDEPVNVGRFVEGEATAFHNTAVEHRSPSEFFTQLGPAFDWIRVTKDLLPGVALGPLARVAAAADFGNGVSATLPIPPYVFVNPDLTIYLNRLPADEWVGLDARTRVGENGVGYAESALFDRYGRIGRGVQSLLIDRFG